MRDEKIINDCKLLVSRISIEKFNEIKKLITEKQIDSKLSKLKLSSLIDLNEEDLDLFRNIIKNVSELQNLLLIFNLVNEIKKSNEGAKNRTSLVCSGPVIFHDYADNTSTTMIKMINSAKISITLHSYIMMENTRKIFDALIEAAKRGVSIKLAFNDGEKEKKKVLKMWKQSVPIPKIYTFKPNKKGTSLHAKVLIIDSKEILTTSANVTSHGIHSNIELGIRHKGAIASDAEKLIELLEKKKHLVKVNV